MTTTFERQLHLPVSAEEGFAWHERPGALDRLIPPWDSVSVLKRGDGIRNGSVVELARETLRLRSWSDLSRYASLRRDHRPTDCLGALSSNRKWKACSPIAITRPATTSPLTRNTSRQAGVRQRLCALRSRYARRDFSRGTALLPGTD
jgi:hypothetical protein